MTGFRNSAWTLAAVSAAAAWTAPAAGQEAAPRVTEADIPRLVRELGDDDFGVRERAGESLRELGILARPALVAAAASKDAEVSHRARHLLEAVVWTLPADHEKIQAALANYNRDLPPGRRLTVARLVNIGRDIGGDKAVPALVRLLRFEDDDDVRCEALAHLLAWDDPDVRDALAKSLPAGDPATAADWALRSLSAPDPSAAAEALGKAVALERRRSASLPGRSRRFLLTLLARRQTVLSAAGRAEEAVADLAEIVQLDPLDGEALLRLLERHLERGDRDALDALAKSAAARIEADPRAMYVLSEAAGRRGDAAEADRLGRRALQANPTDEAAHFAALEFLVSRGWFDPAEKECRRLLGNAGNDDVGDLRINAHIRLAELQSARGRPGPAAESFKAALDLLETRSKSGVGNLYFKTVGSPEGLRARWLAARLKAATAGGDDAAVRDLLAELTGPAAHDAEATVELVEALRAAGRGADADAAVEAARTQFLTRHTRDQDPASLNSLAWLLARTGRRLDEALDLAKQSVRRRPDSPAGWDTLAEVHFRRGETADAVAAERRALELEPFDAFYRSQMARFAGKR
jgi:tetratricopeptide (TPR) repeat protein